MPIDDRWHCLNGHLIFETLQGRGCVEIGCEYRLARVAKDNETMPASEEVGPNIEKIFEAIPVTINVGMTSSDTIIGWANAFRSTEDGTTTIVMSIDAEASERLQDLAEVFKLYSLGFAGIKRRPE